jgi:hypothetical protein
MTFPLQLSEFLPHGATATIRTAAGANATDGASTKT